MRQRLLLTTALVTASLFGMAQQSVLMRHIEGTGGQITDTLDNGTVVTLDLSTDDVEQENDEVDGRYDDDLDLGWEGDPADQNVLHLGFRFVDLWIPQGASIDSAFIVVHAHEGKSAADVANITIVGEATDDALTFDETNFNDTYLLTDRPQTTAQVSWVVAEEWVIWQPYKSPNIGSIVEEIVGRPGWASGNAMAFILLGEDQGASTVENAREFTSYENIADPDDQDPQGNPGDGANHPERRPMLLVYVNGPLGTEEVVFNALNVYPNPTTEGKLNVELPSDAAASVEMLNINGQVVKSHNHMGGDVIHFNVADVANGVYVLRVAQGERVYTERVILK